MSYMDELKSLKNKKTPVETAKALVGLMTIVSAADGNIDDSEVDLITEAALQIDEIKHLDSSEIVSAFTQTVDLINQQGFEKAVYETAKKISGEYKKLGFFLAIQAMLADGEIEDDEMIAVDLIKNSLGVSDSEAEEIIRIISNS